MCERHARRGSSLNGWLSKGEGMTKRCHESDNTKGLTGCPYSADPNARYLQNSPPLLSRQPLRTFGSYPASRADLPANFHRSIRNVAGAFHGQKGGVFMLQLQDSCSSYAANSISTSIYGRLAHLHGVRQHTRGFVRQQSHSKFRSTYVILTKPLR